MTTQSHRHFDSKCWLYGIILQKITASNHLPFPSAIQYSVNHITVLALVSPEGCNHLQSNVWTCLPDFANETRAIRSHKIAYRRSCFQNVSESCHGEAMVRAEMLPIARIGCQAQHIDREILKGKRVVSKDCGNMQFFLRTLGRCSFKNDATVRCSSQLQYFRTQMSHKLGPHMTASFNLPDFPSMPRLFSVHTRILSILNSSALERFRLFCDLCASMVPKTYDYRCRRKIAPAKYSGFSSTLDCSFLHEILWLNGIL